MAVSPRFSQALDFAIAWTKHHPQRYHVSVKDSRRQRWDGPTQRMVYKGPRMTVVLWQRLCRIFNFSCAYCGCTGVPLTMDHLTPVSKGGPHTLWNIVPACRSCNSKKGDRNVLCPVQPIILLD